TISTISSSNHLSYATIIILDNFYIFHIHLFHFSIYIIITLYDHGNHQNRTRIMTHEWFVQTSSISNQRDQFTNEFKMPLNESSYSIVHSTSRIQESNGISCVKTS